MRSPTTRIFVAAGMLFLMAAGLTALSRPEIVPPRESFATFPRQIGTWTGSRAPDFDERILEVLGVDDYLNWTISNEKALMGLYIGYWGSQRQGDTVHSPMNCLPGSGWQPIEGRKLVITLPAGHGTGQLTVNRMLIERGLDRQLVLYWYQSGRRTVASEYAGKVYTVLDAVRYNRSDAAIVRVVVPIGGPISTPAEAERVATEFVRELVQVLPRFLPV